jgi:lipopolysaccharide transport system permease protein
MAKREISSRYRESLLGFCWPLLSPLLMLCVYTVVFGVIFKAKWTVQSDNHLQSDNHFEFAIILFSGLIIFNFFSECISRAPSLILNNPNYVKKVVFPLEVLPWIAILVSLFHSAASFLILMIGAISVFHVIHPSIILLPLILLPLILFTVGISWILASLGVFIRDIGHAIGIILNILLYMSPVFFPTAAAPRLLQICLHLNPLTYIIEEARNITLWGLTPRWSLLFMYYCASLVVALIGFFWFQKTRKGFADVI